MSYILNVRDENGNFVGIPAITGEAGFSPIVEITEITDGHRMTVTDANGSQTFDVMDGVGGSGDGSIETCTVRFINATISTLVFWYAKVSNGAIVNSMASVGPGSEARMTDVARKSLLAYMPSAIGASNATIGAPSLVNAMYAVGCDHSAAVAVGTAGTDVEIRVNMPTT